jgi:hypothetical protein
MGIAAAQSAGVVEQGSGTTAGTASAPTLISPKYPAIRRSSERSSTA